MGINVNCVFFRLSHVAKTIGKKIQEYYCDACILQVSLCYSFVMLDMFLCQWYVLRHVAFNCALNIITFYTYL